jgi:hypothetical protein
MTRSPVTADDLDHAVRLALATLRQAPADGWRAKAGSLDWDCWSTVEHLADTLFAYACQLASSRPPEDGYVPCATTAGTPGGPECAVHADLKAGPAGLLMTLEACAGIEAAVMRTAPPDARAWHPYGLADAEAFTAMGVVETLLHTHDAAVGLGLPWTPPAGLCTRVRDRLFPDAPADTEPWPTLLWAGGRGDLPGRERLTDWKWDNGPR